MGGKRGRLVASGDRRQAIALIHEASAAGARRHKSCEILEISVRTIERWEKDNGIEDQRKIMNRPAANKLTENQRNDVLSMANSTVFRDLPPSKIVPLLADEGIYIASESTFYRILRAEDQLTHRQTSRPVKHHRPNMYVAYGSNQVWSWDISYLSSQIRGLYFYLYLIVDIYSRKIVGFSVHDQELSEHASNLMTQACKDEDVLPNQLVLHADNGGPMKGATMLATLEKLGVMPSFSRPSVSDDNPYSEALFRTLKYHPTFPILTKFENITAARVWCEKFVFWYNNEHLHSALKFVTPHQRHTGADELIRFKRDLVYKLARKQNPERWSGNTRNWHLSATVTLNPNKKDKQVTSSVLTREHEQERLDGAGDCSGQTANAVRQYG